MFAVLCLFHKIFRRSINVSTGSFSHFLHVIITKRSSSRLISSFLSALVFLCLRVSCRVLTVLTLCETWRRTLASYCALVMLLPLAAVVPSSEGGGQRLRACRSCHLSCCSFSSLRLLCFLSGSLGRIVDVGPSIIFCICLVGAAG